MTFLVTFLVTSDAGAVASFRHEIGSASISSNSAS